MRTTSSTNQILQNSIKNRVLKSLSIETFEQILPKLEKVELPVKFYCYRAEEPITHVYFPERAIGSVTSTTSDGASCEIGIIGYDGIIGIDVVMGVDSSPNDCFIQIPNGGYRMKTADIREEFKKAEELQKVILRYIHAYLIQVSQTALCNRLHIIEQRLARWLLMSHDRTEGDQVNLTQEFLSLMLGVNRPTLTVAAASLQAAGFIKYSRGKITMLDREDLENFVCECYEIVRPKEL